MDDLISRQAAIDAVCMEWCGVKHQDCKHPFDVEKDDYFWCDGCETALRTLPDLPSAQPEPMCVAKVTLTDEQVKEAFEKAKCEILAVQSAQPEIIRCKDCIYYDPPHVENNGVRYEYDEMPADAFDALGTGLVSVEYGINIGGRCCVDYYCKNYSDDKRVFVREDDYCSRAERRTGA